MDRSRSLRARQANCAWRDDQSSNGAEEKPFLREAELAERWQVSKRTLQRWRQVGTGPSWGNFVGSVRYALSDILEFEARNLHKGTGE